MTYAGAIMQLKTITFTGLQNSYDEVLQPPADADIPALVIRNASQPFVEGIKGWDVALTIGRLTVFIDHLLLISAVQVGSYTERWDDRVLYLDRYASAIVADLKLNDNLVKPLSVIVVKSGDIQFRERVYNGLRFRHFWEIKIT